MGKNILLIFLFAFLLTSCGKEDEIQSYINEQSKKISEIQKQIDITKNKKEEVFEEFSYIKNLKEISSDDCQKGDDLAVFGKQNFFKEIGHLTDGVVYWGNGIKYADYNAEFLTARKGECTFVMQKEFKGNLQYKWINYSGLSELDNENLTVTKKDLASPFLKRDLMVYFADVEEFFTEREKTLISESEEHLKTKFGVDYDFETKTLIAKK